MQLKDYSIPKARITLPGKVGPDGEKPFFEVRGLCADDLSFLISEHLGPISKALAMYQENREDVLRTGSMESFIVTLARDLPFLVSEVISAAADELDDSARSIARKLPLTVQVAALSEILRLSLEEVGDLKNLLAEMQTRLRDAASVASETGATARPKIS